MSRKCLTGLVLVMVVATAMTLTLGCGREAAPTAPGTEEASGILAQEQRMDATWGELKYCYSLPEPQRSECLRKAKGDD